MTQVSGSTVWGTAERIVVAPVGRVRSEIVRLLGQRGFSLTTDQLTVLEGHRGSALAGASRNASKVPVLIRARLTAGDPGCAIWMEVRDGWRLPMSRPVGVYQDIIGDVLQALDDALRRLDPEGEPFGPIQRSWHAAYAHPGVGDDVDGAVARMAQGVNQYLDHDAGDAPRGWSDRGMVSVVTPRGAADLRVDTLYSMVTVGTLVAARPGPMPPKLVSQVEQTVGMFERMLEHAAGWEGNSWIELDEKAVPVVEFLVQQAKIREAVPLRTLQVCITCRLAKVVNPDYARLRSRTNKLRTLQSSLGAVISMQGISPFVLIGKLAQLNQLDPEFVCPRCQGATRGQLDHHVLSALRRPARRGRPSPLRQVQLRLPLARQDHQPVARTRAGSGRHAGPRAVRHGPARGSGRRLSGDRVPGQRLPAGRAHSRAADWRDARSDPVPRRERVRGGGRRHQATLTPRIRARRGRIRRHLATRSRCTSSTKRRRPRRSARRVASSRCRTCRPRPRSRPQHPAAAVWPGGAAAWSTDLVGRQQQRPPACRTPPPVDGMHLLPAWYPDPSGRHEFRWWDGQGWAEFVLDQDQSSVDPL